MKKRTNRPQLLVIDEYIEAKDKTKTAHFKRMLTEVIAHYPNHDIIIQSPGGSKDKKTYLNRQGLTPYTNLVFIDATYDVSELFMAVEHVFVVNSLVGFFALLAGKTVHCYGAPFYANWGLTVDKNPLQECIRKRTLIELFYFSCIYLSRYYSPLLKRKCTLSEYIDYMLFERSLSS